MNNADFNPKMRNGSADSKPRNLLTVLKVKSIQAAMDALCERCNGTGQPDFSGLMVGDYIDGIDLSAIPAENEGDAGQAWDNMYKNNQIVLSGFNTFKHTGDTEITKNHILFTFRHIPLRKRMNPTDDTIGGYPASELRAFLEGVNGDGTGDKAGVTTAAFLNALKNQIGDHILPVRKLVSNAVEGVWITCSLWIPTEYELYGRNVWDQSNHETKVHFPIHQRAPVYKIKNFNGNSHWHWEGTHDSASADWSSVHINNFAPVSGPGHANYYAASALGGCSPAFCVA